MYDRASRDLSRPLNTTIESVGPGSYELPGFLYGRNKGACKYTILMSESIQDIPACIYMDFLVVLVVGYAPFGSMTSRETFVDVNDQTIAAPGPGQYDPLVKNLDRIKGGQSLSNTV
jgi:hypothetical protein